MPSRRGSITRPEDPHMWSPGEEEVHKSEMEELETEEIPREEFDPKEGKHEYLKRLLRRRREIRKRKEGRGLRRGRLPYYRPRTSAIT